MTLNNIIIFLSADHGRILAASDSTELVPRAGRSMSGQLSLSRRNTRLFIPEAAVPASPLKEGQLAAMSRRDARLINPVLAELEPLEVAFSARCGTVSFDRDLKPRFASKTLEHTLKPN